MNLLSLLQEAKREMGVSGPEPTTAQNLTGEMLSVRKWVLDSYREICAAKANWKFLRSRFSVPTVVGQEAYLITACTDTKLAAGMTVNGFARWITEKHDTFRIYLTADGIDTQQNIWPMSYDWFRFQYQRTNPPASNKPVHFAIREDDNAILLGPKPNALYTVIGEYYRRAPDLDADADVPLFPERFHMAIVWKAVQKYARFEEDGGLYAAAQVDYKAVYAQLLKDQLPRLRLGGPMA